MAIAASVFGCGRLLSRTAFLLRSTIRSRSAQNTSPVQGLVPKTSLSLPPWPEIKLPDPAEEAELHKEIVQNVNELIATGQYGRLFAVVHFASRQWKITSEDLILIENHIPAECGDRIRMEKRHPWMFMHHLTQQHNRCEIEGHLARNYHGSMKFGWLVLLVGADNFTLLGRPLLGKDLVRVEATVIEKTESWPRVNVKFRRRKSYETRKIFIQPQTVLRINSIEIAPVLS